MGGSNCEKFSIERRQINHEIKGYYAQKTIADFPLTSAEYDGLSLYELAAKYPCPAALTDGRVSPNPSQNSPTGPEKH